MGTWFLPLIDVFAPGKRAEFAKMGDINMDGVIDEKDNAFMQAAWGKSTRDPLWNTPIPDLEQNNPLGTNILYSACDLNGDGIIDVADFGILARNYGKDIWVWLGWPSQGVAEWTVIGSSAAGVALVGAAVYTKATGMW